MTSLRPLLAAVLRPLRSGGQVTVVLFLVGIAAAHPGKASTYYLSPSGKDANSGMTLAAPWRSLAYASSRLSPGDTLTLLDGEYGGNFWIEDLQGAPDAPLTIQALHPGQAHLRGDLSPIRDVFTVFSCSYVTVSGLTITQAPRAAIRIVKSPHVTVKNCTLLNNGSWGIVTSYSDDLLIEGNETAGSVKEHGIYVANSGDRPVLRYNVSHDNSGAGIQINADPKLRDASLGTSGDGIVEEAVIADNRLYNNGTLGGAAINLASVRHSTIENNLLYHNHSGGISLWDDQNTPDWGCKDNLIRHNTVYFRPGEGRRCVVLRNGSTDNRIVNNLFVAGAGPALLYTTDSSAVSDYNLYYTTYGNGSQVVEHEDVVNYTLSEWQKHSGQDAHSISADPRLVSPLVVPFDFHFRSDSPALDAGMDMPEVLSDLDNRMRPYNGRWDLGAYEGLTVVSVPPPSNPVPPSNPAPPPVLPPAPPISFASLVIRPNSLMGGRETVGTVALKGAARAVPVTVTLVSANPAAASVPATVTVPAGATSATFPVDTHIVSSQIVVGITASVNSASLRVNLVVSPWLKLFSVAKRTLAGGSSVQGTLTLYSAAPAGGLVIPLTSANPSLVTLPASVTIPAGATSATFTVKTAKVSATTSVAVHADYDQVTRSLILILTR